MTQAPCENLRELEKLIDDMLSPDQAARIVAHVESCKPCQLVLEGLVTRPIGSPRDPISPGAKATADMMAQPPATESDPQDMLPDPTAGSMTGVHFSGETTDLSIDASALVSDHNSIDQRPRDPDTTLSRSGGNDPAARHLYETDPNPYRPSIPGYEVLEKIGEGGMGVVYLARQTGLNRMVAVKMIRGGQQARADHFARFRIEAEAVAQLHHPNILQIYEIGEVAGLPFVSLELLEGGSLADRLDGTPQPGRQAALLLITLAGAVEMAHDAGIVHRDLKPSNVLFTEDDVPKITDFGLAKRMESDSRQTDSGQIMGSPSYMAPEQARGHAKDVGPAADVYALGAILYEMLTGRPPFKGETPIETVRQVVEDEVVPPSRLAPRLARDLETICLKCLNKEPSRRYASTAALADDLRRYRDGETILARRTPVLERAVKWARRKPVKAAMLCLVAILLFGLPPVEMIRREQQSRRVIRILRDGTRLTEAANAAQTRDKLLAVQLKLSTFLGELRGETDPRIIEDWPARIDRSLNQVGRRLGDLDLRELEERTELEKQKSELAEKQRFRTFAGLRAQAQLSAAEFDLGTGDRSSALKSAREALAVYARDPKAADERWEIAQPLPALLSGAERRKVVDGCYDLLLVMSRAVDPSRGVKILDQAATLRPGSTEAFHVRRADCLARAGDVEGQKRELEQARRSPPVTALDHLLIGRELAAKRQWSEALVALEIALRLEPDQASARLLLAICQYNVMPRRLGEALSNLSDCIGSHPELIGPYVLRALVHGEQAYQTLSQIDRGPAAEARRLRSQADTSFKAAETDYRSALDRHPGDDLRYVLLVNRGGMYLRAGRLEDAIAELESAIRLNPTAYQAYATLGQLYQQLDRLDEASQALSRAIARAPDSPTRLALHRGRARLFASRRHLPAEHRAAALADLDEAIRLDPENGEPKSSDHAERARLLFGAARFEEALAASDAAIAIVPGQPSAHQLRISSLMALKRHGEVLDSCNTFLAREQPTVEILEIRGLARLARQDFSGAIDDYGQALGLRSAQDRETRTRLLNKRGWAYHFADAPRLARDDFEASLKLDNNQSDALAGRGLARVRLGEWRTAVADAEASLRLAASASSIPGDPESTRQAYFNAARIYAQAVEFAAADVSNQGERAVALYRSYRARALDLLDQALRQITDPARRRELLDDPALKPLRLNRRVGETHRISN
jgi:serine/threonine protein kinase/tetratricopeptide (TPR) repeat protein